ncbi:NADP-dependent oxidoreductase [Microbacterium sp. zg.Y1090]|uniref:quinone oxidoreductase family protein n=1 Tax=Microbacterium TaxID=33882 RepID=UPI00214C9313|nr:MULTISPECIES: NADP-dependent oxidoreductase [unclassified Microbacterium]MCR2812252.1 NADP-dependent oxidoreductase [Microbacterium sp. zg.Y1084]MCR2819936.1 NADP-dependent oxidoreductase [Microbacterium sp. zg.Y1090]MDL5486122.1 NADP-dependent oxidoreductase [Microbacterium sp. zg-Y1211]WIM29331.1 NADP-dependent oxidoreductase [Microbacterium sp. zg-Y1090]
MTRAIVYTEFGDPEVLHEQEVADPQLRPGTVAVRIQAAGVNPIDAKLRSGLRASAPPSADKPRRLGMDAAGIVTDVGDDVDGFRVGDPVVVSGANGCYADEIVATVDKVFARPAAVSAAAGAALGIPVGTAYQCVRSLAIGSDDVLLVHGGSGSVGQAVIQFARLTGATVIATCSERRAGRVADLGAIPVRYGDGLVGRVREAAGESGVTAVLDGAGTDEALEASLELLDDRSRIATIVRGADAEGLGIRAFSGGAPWPLTDQQQAWRAEAVPVALALMAAGQFEVELGPTFPLAEAAQAHRVVMDGVDGKVTLVP